MIERKLMIDAENGDEKSMYELGNFYRKGIGTKIDVKKAHKWLIKASKKQNVNATNLLVSDYLYGIFKGSEKMTLELCKKASQLDSKLGEYYLGLCYFKGIGVKRDIEKARYHFTMSAINGFEFARAELKDKAFSIVV